MVAHKARFMKEGMDEQTADRFIKSVEEFAMKRRLEEASKAAGDAGGAKGSGGS